MQKFWMIHGDGCPKPTHRHATLEAALVEARRLAAQHPGRGFIVLEAILCAHTEPPQVSIDLIEVAGTGEVSLASSDALADALVSDTLAANLAANPVSIPF
jgi:hypothetical protein